ncbi:hypothetical protein DCM91_07740 [Chitinophaga costaii]|nr:hypothetical protein DCM91_07740 [Chitinophaga costaii]
MAQQRKKTTVAAVAQPSSPSSLCPHLIYLDTLDIDVPVKALKDTFSLPQADGHYLKIYASDCQGTLFVEQRISTSHRLIFKGYYKAVPEPSTLSHHIIDPVTGEERFSERTVFVPLKTGTWQYFGPAGTVNEELDYDNGHLTDTRSMGDY